MENVNKNEFYARYDINDNGEVFWQRLDDHLREVAELAYATLKDVDAELASWAKLAGYFHDYGKFNPAFQERLRKAYAKERAQRIAQTEEERRLADKLIIFKAPHAKQGMDGVVEYLIVTEEEMAREWGDLAYGMLSFAILGHHAGLADGVDPDEQIDQEIYRQFMAKMQGSLQEILPHLQDFSPRLLQRMNSFVSNDAKRSQLGFDAMMAVRLLFSALVHADHTTSAHFRLTAEHEPKFSSISEIKAHFLVAYERFLASRNIEASDTTAYKLHQKRREIYQSCLSMATQERGLFSLTVPTGGGKTLSSLAFALHHAEYHQQQRVIYVAPFTSILDQTVAIYQHYVGTENLFAHYSTYDEEKFNKNKANKADKDEHSEDYQPLWNALSESWQQPVILTTAVQFWESLFTHKPSKAKKIHHIANSVIILDEIQSIPRAYLSPILHMMRSLVAYGCSVVLCSATQPQFDAPQLSHLALQDIKEMMPNPQQLADDLSRVTLHPSCEAKSVEELAQEVIACSQALVIVNLRGTASKVYQAICEQVADTEAVFHLSGLMAVAHRQEILTRVKEEYLAKGKACYLVSTHLIEAGVDIDFPVVYREEAGLENLIQSAGRCNREFKVERGAFVIFALADVKIPDMYAQQHAIYQRIRDAYGERLFHLDAIRDYYQEIYHINNAGIKGAQGNPLDVYAMEQEARRVGTNFVHGAGLNNMSFASISQQFSLIKDDQWTVIIPYHREVENWVTAIEQKGLSRTYLRKLAPYSVGVYKNHYNELRHQHHIRELVDSRGNALGIYYLEPVYYQTTYHERMGLGKEVSDILVSASSIF